MEDKQMWWADSNRPVKSMHLLSELNECKPWTCGAFAKPVGKSTVRSSLAPFVPAASWKLISPGPPPTTMFPRFPNPSVSLWPCLARLGLLHFLMPLSNSGLRPFSKCLQGFYREQTPVAAPSQTSLRVSLYCWFLNTPSWITWMGN